MALNTLVLSGGQGSRMGGCDKGLAPHQGRPLVGRLIRRLGLAAENTAVSANRNRGEYAAYASLVFGDLPRYAGLGPLAGLASASVHTALRQTDWLLVVPCDTPHLPPDLRDRFLDAAERFPECNAFYAATDTRAHYGVMLLRTALLDTAAAYLNGGGRSICGWLELQSARAVRFEHEEHFRNYNTLQDMELPYAGI